MRSAAKNACDRYALACAETHETARTRQLGQNAWDETRGWRPPPHAVRASSADARRGTRKAPLALPHRAILCPYCPEREADTADHTVEKLPRGRRTVPACKPCNNSTFGRGIEASAFDSLGRMMFLCGCAGDLAEVHRQGSLAPGNRAAWPRSLVQVPPALRLFCVIFRHFYGRAIGQVPECRLIRR